VKAKEHATHQRAQETKQLLDDLHTVRYNIRSFKEQAAQQTANPKLQLRMDLQINLQRRKEEFILGRLKNLDYTEKKGRPKKELADTYKANRVKFTAHLQKENMDYVQQLKENGTIPNISAFLDELIAQHQKNNG